MCWRRGIRAHSYLTSSTPLFHRYRLDSIYLCYSSHCIVQLVTLLPILLTCLLFMASSHLKRKLLRCPSSLPAAWNRRSRERWSRASRGCGSAQGGSRASGASPALVRRCRSCCAAQPRHAAPNSCSLVWSPHLMWVRMTVLLEMFFRAWLWRCMVGCLYMICVAEKMAFA